MEVFIHEYEYNEDLGELEIYFSLNGDEKDTQRVLTLTDFEIIKYTTSEIALNDMSLEEIICDVLLIEDILINYIDMNPDNLPEEEYI